MNNSADNSQNYDQLHAVFLDILKARPEAKSNVCFNFNKGNLSISFFDFSGTNISFWITLGTKKNKLETKYSYYILIDALIPQRRTVTSGSNRRVTETFSMIEDLYHFSDLILSVYDYREIEAHGQMFDCCHRFEECSDAMDCTNPDKKAGLCCTYRRKLKQGIIFYGKNRNID